MEGMGCHCILGIDLMTFTGMQVNFPDGSITFDNLDEKSNRAVDENVKVNFENSTLSLADQEKIQGVINKFQTLFTDTPGYIHVLLHITDTGNNIPVK